FCPSPSLNQRVISFVAKATAEGGTAVEDYVFGRILITIINEATMALAEGVATRSDIDTAMKLGTNYPRGPLEWADTIGIETCRDLLMELNHEVTDGRFAPSSFLSESKPS